MFETVWKMLHSCVSVGTGFEWRDGDLWTNLGSVSDIEDADPVLPPLKMGQKRIISRTPTGTPHVNQTIFRIIGRLVENRETFRSEK